MNPPKICGLYKNITNLHFHQQKLFLEKVQEAGSFFLQIYVCSTHCEVGYKVGQHDIWAWTPNDLKISSVSLGHKILEFPPKKVVPQFLSLHIIFSIIVYIGHNLVCIQNEQNTIFDFFATKFGALLILQECPRGIHTVSPQLSQNFQGWSLHKAILQTF